eukprot:Lithocolla_globosa_v1_NODE_8620_length_799_cov_191.440860.p1 type:complete len:237 gc:universal NODE_8620_length_799_cov_191.440860:745-35(-)
MVAFSVQNIFAEKPLFITVVVGIVFEFVTLVGLGRLSGVTEAKGDLALVWWTLFLAMILCAAILILMAIGEKARFQMVLLSFVTLEAVLATTSCYFVLQNRGEGAFGISLIGFMGITVIYYGLMVLLGMDVSSTNVVGMRQLDEERADPMYTPTHHQANDNEGSNLVSSSPDHVAIECTCKAIFNYDANPKDPNELSFVKDEILEILDRKGKWWRARKQDGTVGIIPSNYLEEIVQ